MVPIFAPLLSCKKIRFFKEIWFGSILLGITIKNIAYFLAVYFFFWVLWVLKHQNLSFFFINFFCGILLGSITKVLSIFRGAKNFAFFTFCIQGLIAAQLHYRHFEC